MGGCARARMHTCEVLRSSVRLEKVGYVCISLCLCACGSRLVRVDFFMRVDLVCEGAQYIHTYIHTYVHTYKYAVHFETQIESLEKELAKVRSQKEQQVSGMSKQYEDQLRRRDKEVRTCVCTCVCM